MPPPSADLSSGRDGNDGAILVLDARVAGKVAVVDILKRAVAGRGADAFQLALISSIYRYFLEDGVTAGRSREGKDSS